MREHTKKPEKQQKPIKFTYKGATYTIDFIENNYVFTMVGRDSNPSYFNRIDHLLMHIMSVLSRQTKAGALHEFMEDLKEVIEAVRKISLHIYNNYTPETELEKATTRWGKHVDEAISKISELPVTKPRKPKKGKGEETSP